MVAGDGCADTAICKDFKQQAVSDTSVQDMYTGYAILQRLDAIRQLRKHTTGCRSAGNKLLCLRYSHCRNKAVLILKDTEYTFGIRQERQLLRMNRRCDRTGRIICIDVIAVIIIVITDRADNRKEILLQEDP